MWRCVAAVSTWCLGLGLVRVCVCVCARVVCLFTWRPRTPRHRRHPWARAPGPPWAGASGLFSCHPPSLEHTRHTRHTHTHTHTQRHKTKHTRQQCLTLDCCINSKRATANSMYSKSVFLMGLMGIPLQKGPTACPRGPVYIWLWRVLLGLSYMNKSIHSMYSLRVQQ